MPPSSAIKEIEVSAEMMEAAFLAAEPTEIVQIGRSEIVDWFGPFDQSGRVSRKHLRIVLRPFGIGGVVNVGISDAGSTNGSSPDQAYADVGGKGVPPGSEPVVAEIVLAEVVTLRFSVTENTEKEPVRKAPPPPPENTEKEPVRKAPPPPPEKKGQDYGYNTK